MNICFSAATMSSCDVLKTNIESTMKKLSETMVSVVVSSGLVDRDCARNDDAIEKLNERMKIKCTEASNTILRLIGGLSVASESPAQDRTQTGGGESCPPDAERNPALRLPEEDASFLNLTVSHDHRYARWCPAPLPVPMRGRDRAKTMKMAEGEPTGGRSSSAERTCQICDQAFSSLLKLRAHKRREHHVIERPYVCGDCGKTFSHKPHRDAHRRLHRNERGFQCETCGKAYTNISQLKTHALTHLEKSFSCDVCGRAFHRSGHLKRHKLVHEGRWPFHCDVCGKGFRQAAGLKSHLATHGREQQLCPVCGKNFRNLKDHMSNKHQQERPPEEAHRKRSQGMKLQRKEGEEREEATSGGKELRAAERPFSCGTCEATFTTASNLSKHGSIHSGEMPFVCSECGKQFRLLDYLRSHWKIHLKQDS